jgi:hypothetical protein
MMVHYATAALQNRACSASLKNLSHNSLVHTRSFIKGDINQVKLIFGELSIIVMLL